MALRMRYFPSVAALIIVVSTLVSISLVEVPMAIYVSSNLTCYRVENGTMMPAHGSIPLVMYSGWCVMFLMAMHEISKAMYASFRARNEESYEHQVRAFMGTCSLHPIAVIVFFLGFGPCSDDVSTIMLANVRMTCIGIISVPLISWYFEDMGYCPEVV